MKRIAPGKRARGRPKKRVSVANYLGNHTKGDRQIARDREIYQSVKLSMENGKGREGAIADATEQFEIAERTSVQRKIAPFEQLKEAADENVRRIAAHVSTYGAVFDRLSAVFSDIEMLHLEKVPLEFALKILEQREELERFRMALPHIAGKVCRN